MCALPSTFIFRGKTYTSDDPIYERGCPACRRMLRLTADGVLVHHVNPPSVIVPPGYELVAVDPRPCPGSGGAPSEYIRLCLPGEQPLYSDNGGRSWFTIGEFPQHQEACDS